MLPTIEEHEAKLMMFTVFVVLLFLWLSSCGLLLWLWCDSIAVCPGCSATANNSPFFPCSIARSINHNTFLLSSIPYIRFYLTYIAFFPVRKYKFAFHSMSMNILLQGIDIATVNCWLLAIDFLLMSHIGNKNHIISKHYQFLILCRQLWLVFSHSLSDPFNVYDLVIRVVRFLKSDTLKSLWEGG